MRHRLLSTGLLATVLATGRAFAQPELEAAADLPPPPPASTREPLPARGLIVESARIPAEPAEPDLVRFSMHGEFQLRAAALSELRLLTAAGTLDDLGQERRLYHWLRATPRLKLGQAVELVAQADVRGMVGGDAPEAVATYAEPYGEAELFEVDPRWLYLEYRYSVGSLQVGQQPFHHGMGLVENDGDHPPLFGDYQGGDRFERIEAHFRPGRSKLLLLFAGDLVFIDDWARLTEGELALRGTLGARWGDRRGNVSALAIFRHQRDDDSDDDREFYTVTLDSAGGFQTALPDGEAQLFAEYELALNFGDQSADRALSGVVIDDDIGIRSFGVAARLGAAFPSGGPRRRAFGRWVTALEWGYASADDSPADDRNERFAFDPNHRVGLVLFGEVLRWKTARSQLLAGDPPLGPGSIASQGAVVGATYVNPTVLFRPHPSLDLKAGLVLAQATADFVDPASALAGAPTNYDGGSPLARDLGVELDAGVEWRRPLARHLNLELGAQGGVLFPGHAFDDAAGESLNRQYLAMARLGVQF